MKTSFTVEKDSEGFPIGLDENIKSMAKSIDSGEWTEDNNEQWINYFKDLFVRDEEKLKWLRETNQNRTEKYDRDLKEREFKSAVNDLLSTKNLTEEHVLKVIDEFTENKHSDETIEKLLIFKNIINIQDKEIRTNKVNNYIEKYL